MVPIGIVLVGAAEPCAAADTDRVAPLLDRPLFSPGRRPAGGVVVAPAASSSEPAPRLMGIVIDGSARQAIFAEPHGMRPIMVHEGESVGGYRVAVIDARHVGLDGPSGRRLVMPGSDPAIRTALAALPAPIDLAARREAESENDK